MRHQAPALVTFERHPTPTQPPYPVLPIANSAEASNCSLCGAVRGRQKNAKSAAVEKKKAEAAERYNVRAGTPSPKPNATSSAGAAAAAATGGGSDGGSGGIKTEAATVVPVAKTKDPLTPVRSTAAAAAGDNGDGSKELTPAQKEAQARLDFWNDDPSFSDSDEE